MARRKNKDTTVLGGVKYKTEYLKNLMRTNTSRDIARMLYGDDATSNDVKGIRNLSRRLGVNMPRAKSTGRTSKAYQGKNADTLCWYCANATNSAKCCWAKDFTPVEGWDAIPRRIKFNDIITDSYIVITCPNFKEG